MKPQNTLNGNNAKIDPKKHIESLYQSNMVTTAQEHKDGVPISPDENVEYVRNFANENKK